MSPDVSSIPAVIYLIVEVALLMPWSAMRLRLCTLVAKLAALRAMMDPLCFRYGYHQHQLHNIIILLSLLCVAFRYLFHELRLFQEIQTKSSSICKAVAAAKVRDWFFINELVVK